MMKLGLCWTLLGFRLEKIKGLPVAKVIGADLTEKKEVNFGKIMFSLAIIMLSVLIVVYLQRSHNKPGTEEEYEQQFILKQREKLLKQVKNMKFSSNVQAENYMKNLGLCDEDKIWILKRL